MMRDGLSEGDEELGEAAVGWRGKMFRVGDKEGEERAKGARGSGCARQARGGRGVDMMMAGVQQREKEESLKSKHNY